MPREPKAKGAKQIDAAKNKNITYKKKNFFYLTRLRIVKKVYKRQFLLHSLFARVSVKSCV